MSRQAALFSELRTKPELLTPPGFRYQENVITEAAEAALVTRLQTLDLKPFEFHGHLGNRRVISFGLRYDYSRRSVEAASELPPFLNELRTQAAEFGFLPCDQGTFAGHGNFHLPHLRFKRLFIFPELAAIVI